MISKAQDYQIQNGSAVAVRPKLTALERGMITWAVLDPGDKVLDMNPCDGLMLEYLARYMECEVCGISNHMESVKQTRTRLQNADILYAQMEDIPWRENSFDIVFLRRMNQEESDWDAAIKETLRVLKPGGQFLLGATCYPAPLRPVVNLFSTENSRLPRPLFQSKTEWIQFLTEAGYEQVTWEQVSLSSGVAIGWKPFTLEGME